jgi:hypothetical protein
MEKAHSRVLTLGVAWCPPSAGAATFAQLTSHDPLSPSVIPWWPHFQVRKHSEEVKHYWNPREQAKLQHGEKWLEIVGTARFLRTEAVLQKSVIPVSPSVTSCLRIPFFQACLCVPWPRICQTYMAAPREGPLPDMTGSLEGARQAHPFLSFAAHSLIKNFQV